MYKTLTIRITRGDGPGYNEHNLPAEAMPDLIECLEKAEEMAGVMPHDGAVGLIEDLLFFARATSTTEY